jgi:TrmH family RNA methyltransferase
MREPRHLTSADNPRVKQVLRLYRQRDRNQTGLFVVESIREISRAVSAGLRAVELYFCPDLTPGTPSGNAEISRAIATILDAVGQARQFTVTEPLMKKMAYCENPQPLLAVFEQPKWDLQQVAVRVRGTSPTLTGGELWLVAAGTQKPGNLGAMVRTAEAAGCTAVLVADPVVDPFNPNAVRASTGAVFTLPVIREKHDTIVSFLAERGVQLYVANPGSPQSYTDADMTGPTALVIGSEDTGLDAAWLRAAHEWSQRGRGGEVSIPLASGLVDSLNASIAAAVLLFEAVRQRRTPSRPHQPTTP